jgi:hypothetical protein
MRPNPSIERTCQRPLRALWPAAHVKRCVLCAHELMFCRPRSACYAGDVAVSAKQDRRPAVTKKLLNFSEGLKNEKIFTVALVVLALSACSIFRGPPGPKLYDNATLVITSNNVLLTPQTLDNEFMRTVRARLNGYTESELASEGDLKLVQTCGPRTLKIVQDIASVNIGSHTHVSLGLFLSATAKTISDISVSITEVVEDCETGRKLFDSSDSKDGADIATILSDLAHRSVKEAYDYQRRPRK